MSLGTIQIRFDIYFRKKDPVISDVLIVLDLNFH